MRTALATALALLVPACGLRFDVSRIAGPNATFGLLRAPEEAILPECRLVIPPYAPEAEAATVRIERRFEFRGEGRSIAVEVDARRLEASRAIGIERCVMSEFDADEFYEGVVFDPAEEPFFEALLAELRGLRAQLGLDGSGYADLLVAFVQSLDYEADEGLPKHPIAAFADGVGDCDERSALLAGLLAREGYDVCLFLFLEEQHMAVGLRAEGIDYRGTGYAYVEATQPSYVGRGPLGEDGPSPELLAMGDGELAYAPSPKQRYLAEAARFAALQMRRRGGADGPVDERFGLVRILMALALEGDLDAAFSGVSAAMDPAWDAMIRAATGWPGGGGIPSPGEP